MKILIDQQVESKIPVYMTVDEASLFVEFKKNYKVIAYILGFMNTMNINDMKETNVSLDIDKNGSVGHASITKHFRS